MSRPASSSRAWACGSSGPPGGGRSGSVPELRPERGQHQHRAAGRVPQQLPQSGRDPLPQPAGGHVEVELGLVQPDHGPRADRGQLAQRRLGAGRVDRMPQPPPLRLVPQRAAPPSTPGSCPVEDPPTSTAIPLAPLAAARTTWRVAGRARAAGTPAAPAARRGSPGCTGRCTSRSNGSVTSTSSRPACGPPGARPPAPGRSPPASTAE